MRRSLLFRLFVLSIATTSLTVIATALVATFGAGARLYVEPESVIGTLDVDAEIYLSLRSWASDRNDWEGVETVVDELAELTGREIALKAIDGELIASSAGPLVSGADRLPPVPAAEIDVGHQPVELYLGSVHRLDLLSSDNLWHTVGTVMIVLAAAGIVTALGGWRLVRPVRALTEAAQQMESGDCTARVPVRGNDEVTRLGEAFNAMAESIEAAEQQRRSLVSDVAHELRTPLANVRSHLEAVELGVVPLDTALVRSLYEEAMLLERLVSDLHDLALADAGMLAIHPEERDAVDVANQAVAAHRAWADASGVVIGVDVPDEPVPLYADPFRLRQALGNLIVNAITHTPPGGAMEVSVREHRDSVALAVSDTGPGIDPVHLSHVFERFYRTDSSRNRSTGGSGLGLAITRHLVAAHGGRIEVTSAVGKGTRFTIHLPPCSSALMPSEGDLRHVAVGADGDVRDDTLGRRGVAT